jgi:Sec-independent protein translocase protein TatA
VPLDDFWKDLIKGVVVFLTGGGLIALLGWLLNFRKQRHEFEAEDREGEREESKEQRKERRAEERSALTEAYRLIDRQRQDIDRAERKADDARSMAEQARDGHAGCQERLTRALEYIDYVVWECNHSSPPLRIRPWRDHDADPPRVPEGG